METKVQFQSFINNHTNSNYPENVLCGIYLVLTGSIPGYKYDLPINLEDSGESEELKNLQDFIEGSFPQLGLYRINTPNVPPYTIVSLDERIREAMEIRDVQERIDFLIGYHRGQEVNSLYEVLISASKNRVSQKYPVSEYQVTTSPEELVRYCEAYRKYIAEKSGLRIFYTLKYLEDVDIKDSEFYESKNAMREYRSRLETMRHRIDLDTGGEYLDHEIPIQLDINYFRKHVKPEPGFYSQDTDDEN